MGHCQTSSSPKYSRFLKNSFDQIIWTKLHCSQLLLINYNQRYEMKHTTFCLRVQMKVMCNNFYNVLKNYCIKVKFVEKILYFKTCLGGWWVKARQPPICPLSWKVSVVKHRHTSIHTKQILDFPLKVLCQGARNPESKCGESSASQQGLLPKPERQACVLRWSWADPAHSCLICSNH